MSYTLRVARSADALVAFLSAPAPRLAYASSVTVNENRSPR